jgi:hypothetical protein
MRHHRHFYLPAAVALLLVGACCGLPYLAVTRNVVAPPIGELQLGPYRLVVFVSNISRCPGRQTLCPMTARQTQSIYTVILFVPSPEFGPSSYRGYTLLRLTLPP